MKTNIKFNVKVLTVAIVMTMSSIVAFGQGGDPGGSGDLGGDVDAPIDGGLSILLAAGVGYGVKKARDQRKKKSANFNEGAEK